MSSQPLIVLRFRDIDIDKKETIRRHRLIINDRGYCWWGWLFRPHERNPHQELNEIHAKLMAATDGCPYPVGLYDTGQGLIYTATCDAVTTWATSGFSPEVDFTPDYYRTKRAPAWFRFREITEASADAVIGRVCESMPSADPECYIDLLGKKVEKIRDLRRQEVTLWILG
jgi:hypothetical protein